MPRKIMQITSAYDAGDGLSATTSYTPHGAVHALCDDGSVWVFATKGPPPFTQPAWEKLPPVPDTP
jgi:hypothetical protein